MPDEGGAARASLESSSRDGCRLKALSRLSARICTTVWSVVCHWHGDRHDLSRVGSELVNAVQLGESFQHRLRAWDRGSTTSTQPYRQNLTPRTQIAILQQHLEVPCQQNRGNLHTIDAAYNNVPRPTAAQNCGRALCAYPESIAWRSSRLSMVPPSPACSHITRSRDQCFAGNTSRRRM